MDNVRKFEVLENRINRLAEKVETFRRNGIDERKIDVMEKNLARHMKNLESIAIE
jgi:hypothetical protein